MKQARKRKPKKEPFIHINPNGDEVPYYIKHNLPENEVSNDFLKKCIFISSTATLGKNVIFVVKFGCFKDDSGNPRLPAKGKLKPRLASGCVIGSNSIIDNASIYKDCKIGKNCKIVNCDIRMESTIGDNCTLMTCDIAPWSEVGNNCSLLYYDTFRNEALADGTEIKARANIRSIRLRN